MPTTSKRKLRSTDTSRSRGRRRMSDPSTWSGTARIVNGRAVANGRSSSAGLVGSAVDEDDGRTDCRRASRASTAARSRPGIVRTGMFQGDT